MIRIETPMGGLFKKSETSVNIGASDGARHKILG